MAHAFDGHGFGLLLDAAERLFAGALDHQHRLAEIVTLLELQGAGEPSGTPDLDVMMVASASGLGGTPARLGTATDLATTMRQLLSAAEEQQRLAGAMLTRLIGTRADDARRQRARVLIVDDSEDTREMTAAILEDAGFDAITASNGLEGVIAAHYALPAVVLMDFTMPVLNGLEAARLLRESALTRALKVIAYTARPDVHDRTVARSFADVLSKPAMPEAIVAAVRRFATLDGLALPDRNGSGTG